MLPLQEHVPLGPKTTMRIGGVARWYADLRSKEEVEEAARFARERSVPLVVLGGGSNTIFADGVVEALIVRITANDTHVMLRSPAPTMVRQAHQDVGAGRLEASGPEGSEGHGSVVTVESGTPLGSLINELAEANLDLSPLTGIPGTVGGAIFGNAGQGHGGIWIGNFIEEVEVYIDGMWKTFTQDECHFRYRDSMFKHLRHPEEAAGRLEGPIIWSVILSVPSRPKDDVKAEIDRLIKKRIETQPHIKTAGSCFVSLPDGTPAWKVIDAAGLRGRKVGGVCISEKHANFLINEGKGTFADAKTLIQTVKRSVPHPLSVEMRLIGGDGKTVE